MAIDRFRFSRATFEIAENIGNSLSRLITFFGFVINSVFVFFLAKTCFFHDDKEIILYYLKLRNESSTLTYTEDGIIKSLSWILCSNLWLWDYGKFIKKFIFTTEFVKDNPFFKVSTISFPEYTHKKNMLLIIKLFFVYWYNFDWLTNEIWTINFK